LNPSEPTSHTFLQFFDRIDKYSSAANYPAVSILSLIHEFDSRQRVQVPHFLEESKYLESNNPPNAINEPSTGQIKSFKMRSSTILALLGATLAVATPLAHERFHKKAIAYDIITDIVYVTVTEGEIPCTSTPPTTVRVQHTVYANPVEATRSSTSSKVKPTSSKPTSTYVPPPPPTTSTTPPPAPTTTTEAPAPTTEAAAPVETTTQAPVEVAYTTSAAPVVATTAAAATSDDPLSGTGVDKHNTCRSSHSAENVSWNSTLADAAAKLANTCVWGHDM
jgi:outer membrane biosynthesis protein TonB